jgi:hypothetical protein
VASIVEASAILYVPPKRKLRNTTSDPSEDMTVLIITCRRVCIQDLRIHISNPFIGTSVTRDVSERNVGLSNIRMDTI